MKGGKAKMKSLISVLVFMLSLVFGSAVLAQRGKVKIDAFSGFTSTRNTTETP